MAIIKKLIGLVLILMGVAVVGCAILIGVMVVFPEVKIFGYSYLDTVSTKEDVKYYTIDGLDVLKIDVDNFNVNVVYNDELLGSNNKEWFGIAKGKDAIRITMCNHVMGLTNSLDTNKMAKLTYNNGSIKVVEPHGFFIRKETYITIEVPKKMSYETNTNNGIIKFGNKDKTLAVNNLTCSCTGFNGRVNLDNIDISGDLFVKNMIGRVITDNELKNVQIESNAGTFIFKKIHNLTVNNISTEICVPSVTVEECDDVNYNAKSGVLKITKFATGKVNVDTVSANIDIETIVQPCTIVGETSNVKINNAGYVLTNFTADSNRDEYNRYSSYKIINSADEWVIDEDKSLISNIQTKSGSITIKKSIMDLTLETESGAVSVSNAYRYAFVYTKNGPVTVEYYKNDSEYTASGSGDFYTEFNQTYKASIDSIVYNYINNTKKSILDVNTETGKVDVKNIRNIINVTANESNVSLHYIEVRGKSNIKTNNRQVKVLIPISSYNNYKVETIRNKNSNSQFKAKVGDVDLRNCPNQSGESYFTYVEEGIRTVYFYVKGESETNVIFLDVYNGDVFINEYI